MDSLEILRAYLPAIAAAVRDENPSAAEWLLDVMLRDRLDEHESAAEEDVNAYLLS